MPAASNPAEQTDKLSDESASSCLNSPFKLEQQQLKETSRPTGRGRGKNSNGAGGSNESTPRVATNHDTLRVPEHSESPVQSPRQSSSNAGMRRFTSTLSNAFSSKSRTDALAISSAPATAPAKGFHFSDWNQELGAIESDPSLASSPAVRVPARRMVNRSTRGGSNATSSGATDHGVSQVTSSWHLTRSSGDLNNNSLFLPTETRRRKSDEMEEEERDAFSQHASAAAAVPRRRTGGSAEFSSRDHATRSPSLAHAHVLRSSRSLSFQASLFDTVPPFSSASSSTTSVRAPILTNPFAADGALPRIGPSSELFAHLTTPPPHKRLSVDRNDMTRDLYVDTTIAENLFAPTATPGGSLSSATAKKCGRTKSLSRSSAPSYNLDPIPSSHSHPGWTGAGLTSVSINRSAADPPPTPAVKQTGRSRASSFTTALETLDETGPAPKRFSHPSHDDPIASPFLVGTSIRSNANGSGIIRRPKASMLDTRPLEEVTTRGWSMPDVSMIGEAECLEDEDEEEDDDDPLLTSPRTSAAAAQRRASRHVSNLMMATGTGGAPATPSTSSGIAFPSRRVASLDSLFLSSIQNGSHTSPFGQPGTITARNGRSEIVHPSMHPLRDHATVAGGGGGRKRNANGALLVGPGFTAVAGTSNLAAASPINASHGSSSPAPWNVRDDAIGDLTDDEDDSMTGDDSMCWDSNLSPPPPPLTDGTTSASSSLSTSLSSHAEGGSHDHHVVIASGSSRSIETNAGEAGATFFTPQNYKNVRPLAAAFMSTGLVSKRSRPRGNSLGGPPMLKFQPELVEEPISTTEPFSGNPSLTIPLSAAAPALNRILPPDTPMKRLPTSSHAPHPEPIISPVATHTGTPGLVVDLVEEAGSSSPSDSPSSDTGRPGSQSTILGSTDSLSPLRSQALINSREARSCSTSPRSQSSLESDVAGGASDASPTTMTSRTNPKLLTSVPKSLRALSTLIRRRSSGQLSSSDTGSSHGFRPSLAIHSGSSSGSSGATATMLMDSEPMTPTRSVNGGQWWESRNQLLGTPTEAEQASPLMAPPPPIALSTNPHPLATAHGRQSFPLSEIERRTFNDHSGVRLSTTGRPQYKTRHSSGNIDPVRSSGRSRKEITRPSWFESNFTIIRSLGNGAFSDAYEVVDHQRNEGVYAVKRTKQPFGGPKDRVRRLEEVDILRSLSNETDHCPHLISLVDAWEQNGHLLIETEVCTYGNLAFFLEEFGREHEFLDEARVWKILAELSSGVNHLHSRDIIHLDLKPANVFVNDQGSLKIGDFGLATRWPRTDAASIVRGAAMREIDGPRPTSKSNSANSLTASNSMEGVMDDGLPRVPPEHVNERRTRAKSNGDIPEDLEREGDREYIAPEILAGRYGKAADIFSLGLIILESAANVVLPDNGPAWHKLRQNDFTDVDLSRLSFQLVQLIQSMLQKSPDIRVTTEMINHVGPVYALLSETVKCLPALREEKEGFLIGLLNGSLPTTTEEEGVCEDEQMIID